MNITLQQLNKISPAIVGVRGQNIANAINKVSPMYKGMEDRLVVAATISNLIHESGEFTRFVENLNYSVRALTKLFSRNRITLNQCYQYGRVDNKQPANQKAIANTIYGGNWGRLNLGNTPPNDGWDFRGSGGMQATGRKTITLFTTHYNRLCKTAFNVLQITDQLRDKANLEITMHFACWFITEFKGIAYLAKNGRFKDFCISINGGLNGYTDRLRYYNRAISVIK